MMSGSLEEIYATTAYREWIGRIPDQSGQVIGSLSYFGINKMLPSSQTKPVVENALVIIKALDGYPFPRPISAAPFAWYLMAQPEVKALAIAGKPLNPVETRIWITMWTLRHYESLAGQIAHHFEERADDAGDRARRTAIFNLALSVVISVVFPAAIATAFSTVRTVVATVYSLQQQREAIKDMEDAAAAFEATDAAFAKEIRFVTAYYEKKLADIEAQSPVAPAAPVGTAPGAPEAAPEAAPAGGVPTEILVGGGIAAAAATVALVFLGGR
jgi:hypothetical protein